MANRNYGPPGVSISETESTLATSTGIPPTLVALVGPASGFQISTEQFVISPQDFRLAHQGIDVNSVSLTQISTGQTVEKTRYSVNKGNGSGQNYYVTVSESETEVDPLGAVFATYTYTESDYYEPTTFDNFEDVKDVYGEPLNLDVAVPGEEYDYINSPLTLGAMVAFLNGATEVVMCACEPLPASATSAAAKSTARRSALVTAYNKMSNDRNVNVMVPITTGIADADTPSVLSDLKAHISALSADGVFRFGVVGFDPEVTTPPDQILATSGAAYKKIMLAYADPKGMLMYSGPGNSSFAVGHQYLAAAYAGKMSDLPVQFALTRQQIAGFSGLAGRSLSNSQKNSLAAGGVALTETNRSGQAVVRHGLTTDMTNVNSREASVVRSRDALVTSLAEGMDGSGLVGSPIVADTLLNVKSAASGILESAVSSEAIYSYQDLAVRQNATDPSRVEVKFSYRPSYPLNYIDISFSIDLTAGTIEDLTTAAV